MAKTKSIKKTFVTLKAKDTKKEVSRPFEITVANKLITCPNSQWILNDSKFEWNGQEITSAKAKD